MPMARDFDLSSLSNHERSDENAGTDATFTGWVPECQYDEILTYDCCPIMSNQKPPIITDALPAERIPTARGIASRAPGYAGLQAGGPGSDVRRPATLGAPSFAQFAKGGNSGR